MPPKRSSKATRTFALRCSDEDLEIFDQKAKAAGLNKSDYARKQLLSADPTQTAGPSPPLAAGPLPGLPTSLSHWHVDDLGEDNLRLDNGAMGR